MQANSQKLDSDVTDLSFINQKISEANLKSLNSGILLRILTVKTFKDFLRNRTHIFVPLNVFIAHDIINKKQAVIAKKTKAVKAKQLKEQKLISLNSEKHQKTLQIHKTNNFAPICLSMHDTTKPAYIPKTIVDFSNLKGVLNTKKKQNALLKQFNHVANLSDQARGEYFEALCDTRIITEKDCKKYGCAEILIGQKGVFAKKDIPEHTLINYYSGVYFMNPQEKALFTKEYGSEQTTYGFSFPNEKELSMTGYLFGNDVSLINAGTTYSGDAYKIAHEITKKCNTMAVYAKSLEFPNQEFVNDPKRFDLVTYVSTRKIKKGEELLVNYGMNYWRKRIDNFTKATQEELDQQLINLRRRFKKNNNVRIKMK